MVGDSRLLCRAKALYPYTANDGSSVSFKQGDIIDVLAQLPSGWWDGLCNGVRGWFPSNYVEIIQVYTDCDPSRSRRSCSPNDDSTGTINSGMATSDTQSQGSDAFRPTSSQQSSKATTFLFDDQLEQNTPYSSLPASSWTIDTPKDGSLASYYYNQRTGEIAHTEDTTLLDDDDNYDDTTGPSDIDTTDDYLSSGDSPDDLLDFGRHQYSYTQSPTGSSTSSSSSSNDNNASWSGAGGDWFNNADNGPQLPAPWVRKPVAQRGFCYYNLATHEVAWDINDIIVPTDEEVARNKSASATATKSSSQTNKPLELPKPQPRSPAHKLSIRRKSVVGPQERLTWKKISVHIALAIHNFNIAARNSNPWAFELYAESIVDAIRFMLLASGTVDKDSIHLRTSTVLRAHHRVMMASLSKLVLSTHACMYNPMDNIDKMLSDSNELLLAARNFISTGEAIPIPVQRMEPQLQPHKPLPTTNSPSSVVSPSPFLSSATNTKRHSIDLKDKRSSLSLDANLAETIESCGDSLKECIDGMIDTMTTYKQRIQSQATQSTTTLDSSRSSLSALLFTQFRGFSSKSGDYLAIFDSIDFADIQSPELAELNFLRQRIYQGVGDFLYKLQVLTDEDVPLDGTVYILVQDGNELKSSISAISHCTDTLAFDPSIRRQQQNSGTDIPEASMFGANGSSRLNVDDSVSSSGINDENSSTSLESLDTSTNVPKSRTSVSSSHGFSSGGQDSNSNSNNSNNSNSSSTSTLRRLSTTSPDHARQSNAKLKKFFGDDIPEQITPKSPSLTDQGSTTVAGGPPDVSMEPPAGSNPTKEDERPWYLQYDYKPNEIVFNMEGSVKGGTLRALVVRLTLHDHSDMSFISTFLLTYRSFCSSKELLTLLEERYNGSPPEGLTDQELDIWMNKKLKVIRLRVFNVLKNWLEQYYNEDDHVILDELLQFTTTEIRSTLRFSAEQLERLIRKRQEATGDGLKKMVLTISSVPPVPILPRNRKKFRLLDIDPLEVARQLTIMDFKLYSSIRPVECLNKAWSKEAVWNDDPQHRRRSSHQDGHLNTSHIRASIEYCNQVTSWVSDVILSQLEVKKRVTLIKHWVQIAERCRQLNNFNTCMAILSAFDNSAVGRLKRTWEMVGARTNQILSQIRKLLNANRNFMEYRSIIHSVNPPCIPFLGIYLQDLTFIEDGNSDFLKTSKDMINFAKRAKTAEVIREIQQYQSTHYQLTTVDEIQAFIQTNLQSTRDEEQLYNESLKLEPREREDEKITRLLQESGFL